MLVVSDGLLWVETEPDKLELSSFTDADDFPLHYISTFEKLAEVPRYIDDDLPEGFIYDDVLQHTLRCAARFSGLFPMELPGQVKSAPLKACERMLYIHDLGEVDTGDNNSVKGEKGKKHKDNERAEARKILSDSDFYLYSLFEAASDLLKGMEGSRIGQAPFERASILAKLIDSIDGNIVFHKALSVWIKNGNPIEEIPPKYIEWTFKQYSQYKHQIERLNMPDSEKAFMVKLLDTQLFDIRGMWGNDNPMPQVLREKFESCSLDSEPSEESSQE